MLVSRAKRSVWLSAQNVCGLHTCMQKVHRTFAVRPPKLKELPVLSIILAFSRFPRHFEGQRYLADALYSYSYSKIVVTISI